MKNRLIIVFFLFFNNVSLAENLQLNQKIFLLDKKNQISIFDRRSKIKLKKEIPLKVNM